MDEACMKEVNKRNFVFQRAGASKSNAAIVSVSSSVLDKN